MSNANNSNVKSEVKQAAEQADSEQIKKNLADEQDAKTPENLTDEQKTPFIDDTARTDKDK